MKDKGNMYKPRLYLKGIFGGIFIVGVVVFFYEGVYTKENIIGLLAILGMSVLGHLITNIVFRGEKQ